MQTHSFSLTPTMSQRTRNWIYAALLLLAMAEILAVTIAPQKFRAPLSDTLQTIGGLCACGLLTYAARSLRRRNDASASGWALLACSAWSWISGMVTFTVLETATGKTPYPGIPDLFFCSSYPLMMIGLHRMPRKPQTQSEIINNALDLGALGLMMAVTIWLCNLGPLTASLGVKVTAAGLASTAYAISDFVMLIVLFSLLLRKSNDTSDFKPTLMLLAGIFSLVVSDLAQGYLASQSAFSSGTLFDTGWVLFGVFVSLAALEASREKKRDENERIAGEMLQTLSTTVTTNLWIVVGFSILAWTALHPDRRTDFLLAGTGAGCVLAVVRQIRMFRENMRLYKELHAAQMDLEKKVESRTAELVKQTDLLRHTQAQLIEVQKLEAVGQLAGGVAHDFNNILAAMMMNLGMLLDAKNLTPEVQDGLNELQGEANRAANLVRQLLLFSRKQVLQKQCINPSQLISNLLKMLHRVIGEHVRLEFREAQEPIWIDADPGMIEQVVLNLVVNARDAMPKGGTVVITIEGVEIKKSTDLSHPRARPGFFACLGVSDSGKGMDKETLKRIFEPFFTTKAQGKGTGLGLATVDGIVSKHKGWVLVSSAPGCGTTFRIFLPATRFPLPLPGSVRHRDQN